MQASSDAGASGDNSSSSINNGSGSAGNGGDPQPSSSSWSQPGPSKPRDAGLNPKVEEPDYCVDPKPGPSTTAADFDLEVFDSGSSCSLEDYYVSEAVLKSARDALKSRRNGKKKNKASSSSNASSPAETPLRASFALKSFYMEEEESGAAGPISLGSPVAGPSGVGQQGSATVAASSAADHGATGGVEDPPESACPSDAEEDDDDHVQPPKDCLDRSEVISQWKCSPQPSTSKDAAKVSEATPSPNPNDSNSPETIDAIVQDHDNFGTDETEGEDEDDSMDAFDSSADVSRSSLQSANAVKFSFNLSMSKGDEGEDCLLETAAEVELFDALATDDDADNVLPKMDEDVARTHQQQQQEEIEFCLDPAPPSAAAKKRKSEDHDDENERQPEVEDSKKLRLTEERREVFIPEPVSIASAASCASNASVASPSAAVLGWLDGFSKFSRADKQQAIDMLISSCQPDQVRHMLAVIEPQFQRDFISHLPIEISLYVLSFLSPKDLLRAAQTCKTWRTRCEDNMMWRDKCKEAQVDDFQELLRLRASPNRPRTRQHPLLPTSPSAADFVYSDWKSSFMRQHRIETNWRLRPVRQPVRVLKGHDDHVITCLQFDNERIVSGSDDNTLKVWSAITGKCLRTLVGHTGGVWSSQMEGNKIVSGSTDRTLKVWDADSGACVHTLYGHTSTVRCMHLYKKIVVSGSRDASLRMWDIETGECLHLLVGHIAAVRCVQYNGTLVVSGAYDYLVKVWNPVREECIHTLSGHTNRVYSLQFDGVHVVSGSLDTTIRVWDVETGACKHSLMGHQSLTSGMELRNNILVSGNADSTVKVWDIVSGQCLQTLSGPNKHQSAVTCLQFNSKFVVTSSDDGTVKLWDVKTGEFIRDLVALESGGSGGVVWRIRANQTKLVCAVGSRNGTEETKLLVLDFDMLPGTGYGRMKTPMQQLQYHEEEDEAQESLDDDSS